MLLSIFHERFAEKTEQRFTFLNLHDLRFFFILFCLGSKNGFLCFRENITLVPSIGGLLNGMSYDFMRLFFGELFSFCS